MAFDPPDTAANPDALDAHVEDFWRTAGYILGRSGDLRAALDGAAISFSDIIAQEISSQAGYNEGLWKSATQAIYYGAGVTQVWANAVREYKRKRQDLINEWNTAESTNFGVVHRDLSDQEKTLPADQQAALAKANTESYNFSFNLAKQSKLTELTNLATREWNTLQETASDLGKRLTEGPTPENVRRLIVQEALSWAPYNVNGPAAPLPLNPDKAELDADRFKQYLNGELPPDADYAAMIAALNAASLQGRQLQASGGQLDYRTIAYLEKFYGTLGEDLFTELPAFINGKGDSSLGDDPLLRRDTLQALGDGLLMLSNERLGGGYDKLPQSVRDVFGRGLPYTYEGSTTEESWGRDYVTMAQLLDGTTATGGKEFSTQLVTASLYYMDHDNRSSAKRDTAFADLPNDWPIIRMLHVATRNIEADHAILTGTFDPGLGGKETVDLLTRLYTFEWSDGGSAASSLTSWIHEDSPYYQNDLERYLAADAATALINTVTGVGEDGLYSTLTDIPPVHDGAAFTDFATELRGIFFGPSSDPDAPSVGMVNPELSREFAKIAGQYFDDFASEPSTATSTTYEKGHLDIPPRARARFFELISGDPGAALQLATAVELYQKDNIHQYYEQGDPNTYGSANGRLRALLHAGLVAEAMDRTDDLHAARVDAAKREYASKIALSGTAKEILGNYAPLRFAGLAGKEYKDLIGASIKTVFGSAASWYSYHEYVNQKLPEVEILDPHVVPNNGRSPLARQTELTLLEAAVQNGDVPVGDIPAVQSPDPESPYPAADLSLLTGDPERPVKNLDEINAKLQDEAMDAILPVLDRPDVAPKRQQFLDAQSDAYLDFYDKYVPSSPEEYKRFVTEDKNIP
ncbi:hypothetical protein F8568_021715 [Actinomadura sp. LD22]|uniref:TPR repeat domain-containing protein n=1 Tax=Actinomadura physcomitrii TaxID=2650748 RepID=A0A6I4MG27_9ACTN|nr:hypothetical protein [Actinomadura physcomitrii]MWA02947.1 hypothetical protein [Actinomadura physcomitrii]